MREDILPFIDQTELNAVDKATIRAVIRRITERGRMVLANNVLQYISRMLKWAVGVGYINTNPATDIHKPFKERSREHVLTPDAVRVNSICLRLSCEPKGLLGKTCVTLRSTSQ